MRSTLLICADENAPPMTPAEGQATVQGSRPHRAGSGVSRARGGGGARRIVPAPGVDRRVPRARGVVGGHRLAAHRGAL